MFFPQSLRNRNHVVFLNPMTTHQTERDSLIPKVRIHKRAMYVFLVFISKHSIFCKLVFICFVYAMKISSVNVVLGFL